jgi:hypothetical protein
MMQRAYYLGWVLLLVLSLLDAMFTHDLALLTGNPLAAEANPILRYVLEHWGWEGLYSFKLIGLGLLVMIMPLVSKSKGLLATKIGIVVSLFAYAAVILVHLKWKILMG